MKITQKLGIACLLATSSSLAMASGESFDLTFSGEFLPGTCTPSFANDGKIDLGVLTLDQLSSTADTVKESNLAVTISCTADVPFYTTWTDNRSHGSSKPGEQYFSLGADAAANPIGAMTLQFNSATADSAPAAVLHSTDRITWATNTGNMVAKNTSTSFGAVGSTDPAAIRSLVGELKMSAYIRPTSEFDTSGPVDIDASVAMEVAYL